MFTSMLSLSSYIFILIIEIFMKDIESKVHWCKLFIDDIILIVDISIELIVKIEYWRKYLREKENW